MQGELRTLIDDYFATNPVNFDRCREAVTAISEQNYQSVDETRYAQAVVTDFVSWLERRKMQEDRIKFGRLNIKWDD